MEENFPNTINDIYKKPTANAVRNDEILKAFSTPESK